MCQIVIGKKEKKKKPLRNNNTTENKTTGYVVPFSLTGQRDLFQAAEKRTSLKGQ